MNQHTVTAVRATGVVLALLAGVQAVAAPAWAGTGGGGTPAPVAGEDLPLPLPLPPLRPLCAPASADAPSPPPFPALVNVGVQDIGVLSDIGPRTCTGGPVGRSLSRVAGLPVLSGIVPAGP
ncbi:hypothetical protein ACQEVS_24025 [Streptomyces sp. CA-181903]|uniref:hypothetical protein n=1 Tax=Streptomyces sp. CA-181903 TaxID=3240055 RepID=UPI003D8C41C0